MSTTSQSIAYRIRRLVEQAGADYEASKTYGDMVRVLSASARKATPGLEEELYVQEIRRLVDLADEMRRSAAHCDAEARSLRNAL